MFTGSRSAFEHFDPIAFDIGKGQVHFVEDYELGADEEGVEGFGDAGFYDSVFADLAGSADPDVRV